MGDQFAFIVETVGDHFLVFQVSELTRDGPVFRSQIKSTVETIQAHG